LKKFQRIQLKPPMPAPECADYPDHSGKRQPGRLGRRPVATGDWQVICCRVWASRAFCAKSFLVDLIQGLKVTFRYQDPREIYTEQYPMERPQVAERYRGAPRLNVNPDTNETMCIACDLCALACRRI